MTTIIPGNALAKQAVSEMLNEFTTAPIVGTYSLAVVPPNTWATLTFTYPQIPAIMNDLTVTIPAGSIDLNATAEVTVPTTYFIYADATSGVPMVTASTTSPITNALITSYFIIGVIRFKNYPTNDITVYYAKEPAQDGIDKFLHNLKENVLFDTPKWLDGVSLTVGMFGSLSSTAGTVRFTGNEPRPQAAVTDGLIVLDNESTTFLMDNVVTYSDGSPITAGKYYKMLLGILRMATQTGTTTAYLLMRQSKPVTEYTTAAAAIADAEGVAPVAFLPAYNSAVTPIYYVVMSTAGWAGPGSTLIDIRATGILKGGGGGTVASSHHTLLDLGAYDDHPQYLKTDGTRQLSDNWNMGTFDATTTGHVSANHVISTATTGTAPVQVTSTTACTNLNADLLDGNHAAAFQPAGSYLTAGGSVPLTANWDAGAYKITADTLTSDVAEGTAPFTSTSTTVCTNVNADLLDGNHATAFAVAAKGVTNGDSHDHVGGDGAQIDHGGLGGLADDDHTQYLLATGTRALTGNMLVDSGITIDGVDISAHAADASAHHAPITLSTAADVLLGLSTQQITLDSQNAGTVLAGPSVGSGPVAPTFRKLKQTDLDSTEGILTLVNGQNDNVALTDGVDCYLVAGPTNVFGISGFTGGYPGRVITIANWNINFNMTSYHQNLASTAANRIINPGSNGDEATTRYGLFRFQYFGTTQRWVMVGTVA